MCEVYHVSRRRGTIKIPLIVLLAGAGLVQATPVRAQQIDKEKALKVKAAFLYNFAKFIRWPDDAGADSDDRFVMGVLGDNGFARVLAQTVKTRKVHGRPVATRRLNWHSGMNPAVLRRCQVLYIGSSQRGRLGDLLAALKGHSVLIVSDIPGIARKGGMIGFVLDRGRIAFEVNTGNLEGAGLKVSSQLLKLARTVESKENRVSADF